MYRFSKSSLGHRHKCVCLSFYYLYIYIFDSIVNHGAFCFGNKTSVFVVLLLKPEFLFLLDTLPAAAAATVPEAAVEDEEADDDLEEMKSRLEALRS